MPKKQSKPNYKIGDWVSLPRTAALGLIVDVMEQDEKDAERRYMVRSTFVLRSVPEHAISSKLSEKQALELQDFLELYEVAIDPQTLLVHTQPRSPTLA